MKKATFNDVSRSMIFDYEDLANTSGLKDFIKKKRKVQHGIAQWEHDNKAIAPFSATDLVQFMVDGFAALDVELDAIKHELRKIRAEK